MNGRRGQSSFLDDSMFRFLVVVLLMGILWVTVTDYHFEMPQEKEEPTPWTAQDKGIFVWVLYVGTMSIAWLFFIVIYGHRLRDSLRLSWKRYKENKVGQWFRRNDKEGSR